MNMVGAALREMGVLMEEGSKDELEVMALLVLWIGDDGTKASPNAKRAVNARAEKRTMVLLL